MASGGKLGNKGGKAGASGRHPQAWGEFIAELRASDERFRDAIRRAAYDPESRAFGHVLKLVTSYDPEAPERKIAISGGTDNTLRILVEYAQASAPARDAIGSASWADVVQR